MATLTVRSGSEAFGGIRENPCKLSSRLEQFNWLTHAIGAALYDVVQGARDVVHPFPDPREIQVEGGPRAVCQFS
jgi:hypothetical protein